MSRLKKTAAAKILEISEKVAETTVNKSLVIAAYEADIPEEVKAFCESKKVK